MEVGEGAQNLQNGGDAPIRQQGEVVVVEEEEEQQQQQQQQKEHGIGEVNSNILRFLDSVDGYLTLMDSLSSILRQGWFELASARHSMGASRINSVLLDLKPHHAATSLRLTDDGRKELEGEPHFMLCKWMPPSNGECSAEEKISRKDKLSQQLRHRGNSQLHEEETSPEKSVSHKDVDQVQKERSKSLSVFGTLVSPKLRSAQLSFETVLETLVEIANMRVAILSAFDQVQKEVVVTKR